MNQQITSPEILLIDDAGRKLGKVNIDQARLLAFDKDLDLIEVSSHAQPPVCKIIDYGKYVYQKTKLAQKQKSKQRGPETKEIKLSPNISGHDLGFKAERAKEFLARGDKVKIFIILRGRENIFANKAREIIIKFKDITGGDFEQSVNKVGRQLFALIAAKKQQSVKTEKPNA